MPRGRRPSPRGHDRPPHRCDGPVGAHNSVVGADQGLRAPSWDQESVRDSVHEDSASARIAGRPTTTAEFPGPQRASLTMISRSFERVGAQNCVVAGQGAFRYSLMSPPQRAVLTTWRCPVGAGTPVVADQAACRHSRTSSSHRVDFTASRCSCGWLGGLGGSGGRWSSEDSRSACGCPVSAENSAVGVDLQRRRSILIPRVPNLVPIPGITGSAHCALRPLQGPRDHRVAPPTHCAAPTSRPTRAHRHRPEPARSDSGRAPATEPSRAAGHPRHAVALAHAA